MTCLRRRGRCVQMRDFMDGIAMVANKKNQDALGAYL